MLAKASTLLTVSVVALSGVARADVAISNKPTQNMNCDAGVCTATAQKAVLASPYLPLKKGEVGA